MKNGITYLKVKIKSLTAEAGLIRLEERRARRASLRAGLADHRRGVVRLESRHSQLAYAFLREKPLASVEGKNRQGNAPDWKRVASLVSRFDSAESAARLPDWRA